MHRRLKALDPKNERQDAKYDVFALTIPDTAKPLILLRDDATGLNITEQANELVAELEEIPNLELVVIDPIQAMSSAPLSSSNEAAQLSIVSYAPRYPRRCRVGCCPFIT